MVIYDLADETGYLDGIDAKQYVWAVADYKIGDWSGDGEAILCDHQGQLWWLDLSHCSCYGPGGNGGGVEPFNLAEFFGPDVHARSPGSNIIDKVVALWMPNS